MISLQLAEPYAPCMSLVVAQEDDGALARRIAARRGRDAAAEAELCRRLGPRIRLYGLKQSDYQPQWINSGQYTDAMKNGTVDAASLQVGFPAPAPQELCTARTGLRLLAVPADAAQAVAKKAPYFSPGVIPAGQVSEQVGITMDFTATMLAVAGATLPEGYTPEGIDLLPMHPYHGRLHRE